MLITVRNAEDWLWFNYLFNHFLQLNSITKVVLTTASGFYIKIYKS